MSILQTRLWVAPVLLNSSALRWCPYLSEAGRMSALKTKGRESDTDTDKKQNKQNRSRTQLRARAPKHRRGVGERKWAVQEGNDSEYAEHSVNTTMRSHGCRRNQFCRKEEKSSSLTETVVIVSRILIDSGYFTANS